VGGFAAAGDAAAAIRKSTDIPAQGLGPALTELAKEFDFQVLYRTEIIGEVKSPGAVGSLTPEEALGKVLGGTGLTYKFLDDKTVTILRMSDVTAVPSATSSSGSSDDASTSKEVGKKSSRDFRLAQAAQGPNRVSSPVDDGVEAGQKPDTASHEELQEVVVTSHIVRDGYESPTPTSVLGLNEIQIDAPVNIADFVNELPSLVGSNTTTTTTGSVSSGLAGINALNLRALGASRTLVLVDGQRVAASTATGLVDVNTIPQALISRVDVVTGGASAVWGSDAIAGVVNFTLDRKFTGVKVEVQGGATTYGDDKSYNLSWTGGTGFADDRGHAIVSLEDSHSDGITGIPRPWYSGAKTFLNPGYTPTNGQPYLLVSKNVGLSAATPGLIIYSGPLKGTYFGPGGNPAQLNEGSVVKDPFFVGGDWKYADFGSEGDLDAQVSRQSIFSMVSFDVTESTIVFAEASYGNSDIHSAATPQFDLGNLTLQANNAFLPAQTAAALAADGQTSFKAGSLNADLPPLTARNSRELQRYVVGANGSFNAANTPWTWKAYLQSSITNIHDEALTTVTANYNNAINAVRNANGTIVCANGNPACVPYDIFGTGVTSQAAINYVLGDSWLRQQLTQDVASASVQGEPFSIWAGPVSLAAGVEHRRESITGSNDPLSNTNAYFAGNFHATIGSYDVTEGFLETVIPLAKDQVWAKALDLNAAARATDYSTSGYVTTWKAGLTYSPIDDITVRATRSRDIRAPNLNDLYAAGVAGTSTLLDPFHNNASTTVITITSGNTALQPEKANTTDVGLVFRPTFSPGFTASVDYFDIDVAGAIGALDAPTIVNGCYAGELSYCSDIVRDTSGNISQVDVKSFNTSVQRVRGIDFEASYRKALDTLVAGWAGDLTVRLFATHYLENYTNNGLIPAVDPETVGENSEYSTSDTPSWKYFGSVIYDRGPTILALTARGLSAGVYNNSYIQCATDCPTSTNRHVTTDDNHIPGAFYLDTALSYKVTGATTVFLTVENLLDRDPPQVAATQNIGNAPKGINQTLYDVIGRTFRFGVRVRM
jgi:outer membrane receptor protein involved in Fe transport